MVEFPNGELLEWFERVKRPLPWRETQNPYLIWISEIILQQTRVDQGLPYYGRFVERFPTVEDLASAHQDEVLKLWEGLGYYSRARNLHATAKHISEELDGEFPSSHKELLQLKGVGPYTAAAIGSIAFNLPKAAVDGNVIRVISRYFGIEEAVDSNTTKKQVEQLAQQVLDKENAGEHNQAMMELGATCCTPQNQNCAECPISVGCIAQEKGIQDQIPIKGKKTKVRDRHFYYVVCLNDDKTVIEQRPSGDIWQGLYQFPLIESKEKLDENSILKKLNLGAGDKVVSISETFKHILSHQRIFARFIQVEKHSIAGSGKAISLDELNDFAMPQLILRYLEKHPLAINDEV